MKLVFTLHTVPDVQVFKRVPSEKSITVMGFAVLAAIEDVAETLNVCAEPTDVFDVATVRVGAIGGVVFSASGVEGVWWATDTGGAAAGNVSGT